MVIRPTPQRGAQQSSEDRNRNAARRLREKKSRAVAQSSQQGHRAQGHGRGNSGRGGARRHQQQGRGEPAVAQVVKRDECILQDGRAVEAVRMEFTNCGREYELSPQKPMRVAWWPREDPTPASITARAPSCYLISMPISASTAQMQSPYSHSKGRSLCST
jgi:hypothetical protein